ncbi:hypothetical protein MRX96_034985 [Rhipicephalus microplus]
MLRKGSNVCLDVAVFGGPISGRRTRGFPSGLEDAAASKRQCSPISEEVEGKGLGEKRNTRVDIDLFSGVRLRTVVWRRWNVQHPKRADTLASVYGSLL